MMTHAYLHNLANLKPTFGTGLGKLLSCFGSDHSSGRLVFATGKSGGTGVGTDPEKDEDAEEKEKEKKKKDAEAEEKEKEKKKKDAEAEKKKKEKEEAGEGTDAGEEEDIETTKERIGKMAKAAAESSEKFEKQLRMTEGESEKINADKMKEVGKDLSGFEKDCTKAEKPVKDHVAKLLTSKKINKKQAEEILALDPCQADFDEKFQELIKKIPGLKKDPVETKKLLDLKHKEGEKLQEIFEKIEKTMSKFRELSNEMGDALNTKAFRKRAITSLSIAVGLGLEPGQTLVYEKSAENGKDKKKHHATIKKVEFEDMEILDNGGNVVKKVPGTNPKITVQSINPETNKIEENDFNETAFHEFVQEANVLEDIDSVEKLKKSVGCEVKKGSVFDYLEVSTDAEGKKTTVDQKVEVKDVKADTLKVFLDKEVMTAQGKKKELTFGEFAKWFKQKEAVAEIEAIETLRKELYTHREVLNSKYQRDPGQYPPIEAKKDEVLYYDDDSGREFVIKDVDEKGKKIIFDTGEERSFSGFLRWVKREGVEKKTGDAEAKKRSALIGNPQEKAEAEQAAKAQAEKEMDERIKNGKDALPGYAFASPDEHAHPSKSYLRELWKNTYFLSGSDIFEMGKTIWELIKRRWTRRQKGRIGMVGQWMFGHGAVGAEFKNLAQSAENDEVNHHVKTMETMGIDDIKKELHHPPDRDTFKAAITVMCKKGQMRWDDHGFWHALEHLSGERIDPKNYMEDIKKILDKWWGENTFNEFRNSQTSSYNSTKKGFEDDAKRLENDPKGLPGRLRELLFNFIHGEPVHPCEYEAYLHYAFGAGKMAFEDKMFFFIMGMGAKNPAGDTLLHIDRVAAMESELLSTVPLIDFFVSPWLQAYGEDGKPLKEIDKKTGEEVPKKGRPNVNTFQYWINNYILPDLGGSIEGVKNPKALDWNGDSTQNKFSGFVRDVIAWDEYAKVRMEKASRNPENWDHDDMDMFVHLLNEGTVDQILRYSGGARMQVSYTGLKNSFAGLNEFIRRKINTMNELAQAGKEDEAQKHYQDIIVMLKSFIRFDATVDSRFVQAGQPKVRFSDDIFNSNPLCSSDPNSTTLDFIKDMRELVGDISKEIGLEESFNGVMKKLPSDQDAEIKKQAALVEGFGSNLNNKLNGYMKENGMKKVAALLSKNHLRGLKKSTEKNAEEQLKAEAQAMSAMSGEKRGAKPGAAAAGATANDNDMDDFGNMAA